MILATLASPLASLGASFSASLSFLTTFARESYCRRGKVADGKPGMGAVNPVDGNTDPIEAKTWGNGATRADTRSRRRAAPILCKNGQRQPTASSFIGQCHHSLGETVSFLAGAPRAGPRLARYSHMEPSSH